MSKKITFSERKVAYKYSQEYKEQKLNGRVVRLKSNDGKSCDLHEHILRNIPSFADFIDREIKDRIRFAELFSDALYDAADLKDQTWLDLLDLALFVDWMGKADMDKELRLLKRRCFSALEDKLVRSLEIDCGFKNQQWAGLMLVFGVLKVDEDSKLYKTLFLIINESEFFRATREIVSKFEHEEIEDFLLVLNRYFLERGFEVSKKLLKEKIGELTEYTLTIYNKQFGNSRSYEPARKKVYKPFNELEGEIVVPREGYGDKKDMHTKNIQGEEKRFAIYQSGLTNQVGVLGNIPISVVLERKVFDHEQQLWIYLHPDLPASFQSIDAKYMMKVETLDTKEIFCKTYEKVFTATNKSWGSKIEKFPFLEKRLKVKVIFERFTPSNNNNENE